MRYKIYTNETVDPSREYFPFDGFRPGAHMNLAYQGNLSYGPEHTNYVLEYLFETFNIHQPADYYAHSLSVGDVVVLIDGTDERAFACESSGWKELHCFVPELKNLAWSTR